MLNINQVKRLVRIDSINQIERLGFEPDDFIKGALANGLDVLLDKKTGEVLSVYHGAK